MAQSYTMNSAIVQTTAGVIYTRGICIH